MKQDMLYHAGLIRSRAPRGARGLKRGPELDVGAVQWSRPARGAWIETVLEIGAEQIELVAPRAGRVD